MIVVMISGPHQVAGGGDGGVCGVLLAAGAGRRAGGPKALRIEPDGTSWLLRSIAVLRDGGCQAVVVVLGCSADAARAIIAGSAFDGDTRISVVEAPDWRQGMGVSLRAGLLAVWPGVWRAVLVHLVDLPDVTAAVVSRLLRHASTGTGVLARATFCGMPGHPVLIGYDHLQSIMVDLAPGRGAKEYLARHGADGVECGDLATGRDRDQ
jgi:CTP:molybdopterin cytidylyltransferase MocA